MYSSSLAALTRAKQASTLADSRIDDTYASELVTMSAGALPDGTTEYRPFWVAAKLLEQDSRTQRLTETKGTKFDNLQRTVDSLYATQRSLDASQSTVVPEGMEAIAANCDACDESDQVLSRYASYKPTSVRTSLVY